MSRTITAMFDSRSEAEAAREQLRTQLGADARIIDQSGAGGSSAESRGFWADLKDIFIADEDRPTYEEGVRRGHFLLCANVPEDKADRACSLLESGSSVDLEERQQQWRSDGWAETAGTRQSSGGQSHSSERGQRIEEQRIPIVEEQLRVGKRETERGGKRVRSYVEERPVSESVNLRQEHVNVERRPVDQPVSSREADSKGLFQERSVEMRETAEEPVVAKDARIKEEVVLQKTADQRTERVQDTVRNTNVEVDEERGDTGRGAFGFKENENPSRRNESPEPRGPRRP
jgi:stress response protein YsnF